MDTTDPDIVFDKKGHCNHCTSALIILSKPPFSLNDEDKKKKLQEIVKKIQQAGKGKRYDCILGVSGGVDSTYTAYIVKQFGLNPLAIHLDNGWNTELAVHNIENACKKLDIELRTVVAEWGEFKDLQLSFLKASTPDSEIPSDHAMQSLMFEMAEKEGLKHILAGTNHITESILPPAWSQGHMDWKYISAVQNQFGTKELLTFPHMSSSKQKYYKNTLKIEWVHLLDYVEYDKNEVKKIIINELDWRDYGGKHLESTYTKFFQTYILPTKFGFDKRRMHYSNLIAAGQMTRQEALLELEKSPYNKEQIKDEIKYVADKLNITMDDFNDIMNLPKKTIEDYPHYPRKLLKGKIIASLSRIKKGLKDG
jgi:N-acetyl sugar amidotransferase